MNIMIIKLIIYDEVTFWLQLWVIKFLFVIDITLFIIYTSICL